MGGIKTRAFTSATFGGELRRPKRSRRIAQGKVISKLRALERRKPSKKKATIKTFRAFEELHGSKNKSRNRLEMFMNRQARASRVHPPLAPSFTDSKSPVAKSLIKPSDSQQLSVRLKNRAILVLCPVCGVGLKRLARHLRRIHGFDNARGIGEKVAPLVSSSWSSWPISAEPVDGRPETRARVIHSFEFVWKDRLYRPPVGVEGDVVEVRYLFLFSPDHAIVNGEQMQVYVPSGFLEPLAKVVKPAAPTLPGTKANIAMGSAIIPCEQPMAKVRHPPMNRRGGMASFTHYWAGGQCDYYYSMDVEGEPLDHTAGNLFRQRGIADGDKIYVVNVRKGKLYLIGRLRVDKIVSTTEAERLLKTKDLWEANEHVIALAGSATSKKFRNMIPLEVTKKLLFESGGKYKPLYFESEGVLDCQTLRGVRKLTDSSAILLEKFL